MQRSGAYENSKVTYKKNFFISGKEIKLFSLIGIMMIIMIFVVRFSFISGKLQNSSPDAFDLVFPVYVMISCLLPVSLINSSVEADRKSNWNQFAVSSGISSGNVICSKAAELGISALTGVMLGTAFNLLYAHFFGGVCTSAGILISYIAFIIYIPLQALGCSMMFVVKKTVFQASVLVCGMTAGFLFSGKVSDFFRSSGFDIHNPSDNSIKMIAEKITGNESGILVKTGITGLAVLILSFTVMYFTVNRRYRKCGA